MPSKGPLKTAERSGSTCDHEHRVCRTEQFQPVLCCPACLLCVCSPLDQISEAFSPQGAYCKCQPSSPGAQSFTLLGTMPISFVLLRWAWLCLGIPNQKYRGRCLLRPCSWLYRHPSFAAVSCNVLGLVRLSGYGSILNVALSHSHLDHCE